MAKRGGFSKADVEIMVQSNFDALNKQLDSSNQLLAQMTGVLSKTTSALDKLDKRINKAVKSNKNFAQQTKTVTTHLRDWMIIIGQARAALLNLKMVTTDVFGGILKVSSQFERLRKLLEGLSKETNTEKRIDEVNSKIEYLINLSKNAPFSINTLQDAFIKLDTVGLKPAEGSLNALVDAVAAFGGDDEAIKRAGVALQQMAGKGVVSMEELRQQLGESIPTAMAAMARGAKMSVAQFSKYVSLGVVDARTAIDAMMAEFKRMYGGSSEKMMETAVGLLSRLKTEFTLLINEAAEKSGLIDNIKNNLKELVQYLGGNEAVESARQIAAALQSILDLLTGIVKVLFELKGLIAAMATFLLSMNLVKKALVGLGLKTTINSFTRLAAKTNALAASFAILGKSIVKLWRGFKGLFQAITPLTAVGAIIGTIITAFALWDIKTRKQAADLKQLNKEIETMNKNLAEDKPGVEGYNEGTYKRASDRLEQIDERILENNDRLYAVKTNIFGVDQQLVATLEAENEELRKEREQVQQIYDLQKEQKDINRIENIKEIQTALDEFNAALDQNSREYTKANTEAEKYAGTNEYAIKLAENQTALVEKDKIAFTKLSVAIHQVGKEMKSLLGLRGEYNKIDLVNQAMRNILGDAKGEVNQRSSTVDVVLQNKKNTLAGYIEAYQKDAATLAKLSDPEVYIRNTKSSKINYELMAQQRVDELNIVITNAQKAAKELAKTEGKILSAAELETVGINVAKKATDEMAKSVANLKEQEDVRKNSAKNEARALSKINEQNVNYEKRLEIINKLKEQGLPLDDSYINLAGRLYSELSKITDVRKKANAELAIEQTLKKQVEVDIRKEIDSLQDKQAERWAELNANKTKDLKSYLANVEKNLRKQLKMEIGTAEQIAQKEMLILEEKKLAEAEWRKQNQTELQKSLEQWSDMGGQIDQVWANAFDNMADALYEFCKTGELNFENLVSNMVEELTRLIIKAEMAKLALAIVGDNTSGIGGSTQQSVSGGMFDGLLSAFGSSGSSSGGLWNMAKGLFSSVGASEATTGASAATSSGGLWSSITSWFGSGGTEAAVEIATTEAADPGFWASLMAMFAHTGGVIGKDSLITKSVSPEMFVGATKYHSGGIVGLKSDEVPAILQKGEGVFTEEQMKAIGGIATAPAPTVTVNVINNTQDDVSAEQGDMTFDGKQMVLDVVLRAANSPGNFRDSMRSALR